MRPVRIVVAVLIGLLAIVACSDAPDSVEDAVSSLPEEGEVSDAVTDIQSEIDAVATEIQNSEAADELQAAWADMQAQISSTIDSIQSNEAIDTEAIRTELDEFQSELEAAGDEVGDELTAAWNQLRSTIEQMIG